MLSLFQHFFEKSFEYRETAHARQCKFGHTRGHSIVPDLYNEVVWSIVSERYGTEDCTHKLVVWNEMGKTLRRSFSPVRKENDFPSISI